MTFAPDTLEDLRDYLKSKTGLSAAALGIVGDSAHNGGYHCGRDRVTSSDYSVRESERDRRGLSNAASAIDIGGFSRGGKTLRGLSRWLVAQCEAGAEGTDDIREIIYSLDGRTVHRWDRLGRRSSGDSSHRWHTHVSFFRDSEDRSRSKRDLFARYFDGSGEAPDPKPSHPSNDWTDRLIMALPELDQGDKGKYVRRLQALILAYGGSAASKVRSSGGIDGIFGPGTKAAVRLVQRNARPIDGIVGPITWTELIRG